MIFSCAMAVCLLLIFAVRPQKNAGIKNSLSGPVHETLIAFLKSGDSVFHTLINTFQGHYVSYLLETTFVFSR